MHYTILILVQNVRIVKKKKFKFEIGTNLLIL